MNQSFKTGLLSAALMGALGAVATFNAAAAAHEPTAPEGKVKCYGVAKAGQNDCGAADGSHSCAGHASSDNGANDWKFTTDAECQTMGGSMTPGNAEKATEPQG